MTQTATVGVTQDPNHKLRRAEILRAQPEVKALFGPSSATAWLGLAAVLLQVALAWTASRLPWWGTPLLALGLGAFIMHFVNCIAHECAHNLVFHGTRLNKAFSIFVTLPSLAPSALAFRHYHLLHHWHFGARGMDSDVPTELEVRVVGRSRLRKLLWVLLLPLTYTVIHPLQVRQRLPFDGWLFANIVFVAAAWGAAFLLGGWAAVIFLLLSSYLAVGPHPAGAHILQEHIAFDGGNGMSSYYGPINLVSVNLGYHLEHHDLPQIAGWRLPRLHKIVPEFYTGHFSHQSRMVGLWEFVMNRNIGLDSRPITQAKN